MKTKRTYSLFVKVDGKYVRLSTLALGLDQARRVFQNSLLAGSLSGKAMYLRPAHNLREDDSSYPAVYEAGRAFRQSVSH